MPCYASSFYLLVLISAFKGSTATAPDDYYERLIQVHSSAAGVDPFVAAPPVAAPASRLTHPPVLSSMKRPP